LDIVTHAVTLFHHLVFPHFTWSALYPTASQLELAGYTNAGPDPFIVDVSPRKSQDAGQLMDDKDKMQGIDLVHRLKETKLQRSLNAIQHQFMSALGVIAFADLAVPMEERGDFDLDDVSSEFPRYDPRAWWLIASHGGGHPGRDCRGP
jgi:hypothetical protein